MVNELWVMINAKESDTESDLSDTSEANSTRKKSAKPEGCRVVRAQGRLQSDEMIPGSSREPKIDGESKFG